VTRRATVAGRHARGKADRTDEDHYTPSGGTPNSTVEKVTIKRKKR
jgi:hypothetical protein